MLSDGTIRHLLSLGRITVTDPVTGEDCWSHRRVQPASLDVTLGDEFLSLQHGFVDTIDPKADNTDLWYKTVATDADPFILDPGEFALGTTHEVIGLSESLIARVEGKSSVGRMGTLIHITAGFVDPGFVGQITLELANVSSLPIKLYPGMPIGQLAFERLDRPADQPYAGKYVGQRGPVASRYHLNWNGTSW